MSTVLLKNGLVLDGSGEKPFKGSVLIENDSIAAIFKGNETPPPAEKSIEAHGMAISPGFIDMHSHSDFVLPAQNHAEVLKPLVEQGITTIVGGNCGISPAPIVPEAIEQVETLATIAIARPFAYAWTGFDEFFKHMEAFPLLVNMAELAGHATLRYSFSKAGRAEMSEKERKRCMDEAAKALDEGACGLSFGLGYDPGMYASLDELKAFCRVAASRNKPVTMHMKAFSKISPCYPLVSFSAHNVRALKEAIEIAEETGVRLQLSHFIFVGRHSWSTAETCIELVEKARGRGVDIMVDAFPFLCGNTTIMAPFPYWFLAGIPDCFKRFTARARLKLELEIGFRLVGFTYKDFQIMDVGIDGLEHLNGLRITDVAKEWNCSPFKAMVDLAEKSRGATLMLFHTYSGEPGNEKPIEKVLSLDYCLFETDAVIKAAGFPNPAAIGTFPKILGDFSGKRKLIDLQSAIHRMTHASAQRFGIADRGILKRGKRADVVVFDPNTISDSPGAGKLPSGRPKGIEHVFINGQHVVEKGCMVGGRLAGKVIRC